ncbi:MAG: hypothetical protein WCP73_06360 [Eubacteriales bacterium]
MKFLKKYIFAFVLVGVSVVFYLLQNILFHSPEQSAFYFFQDLAFLPLQVLLVSMILESFIKEREKRDRLEELNILVGAFFSEMGTDAILRMNPFITNMDGLLKEVKVNGTFGPEQFKSSAQAAMQYDFKADSRCGDLEDMGGFLYEKKATILGMFENPNLLENNRFTSMLWAVYHVMDEIKNREDLHSLPASDLDHLSGDLQRAYRFLVVEWIFYMEHLKEKYPYLFSLAVRKNPFLGKSSIVITS